MVEVRKIAENNGLNKLDIQKNYITSSNIMDELEAKFNMDEEELSNIRKVIEVYPVKISKYFFELIQEKNDPIWKQCVPDIIEINDLIGEEDPLAEERDSPTPLITHRYPDRLLFLISSTCEMFCRFCTRKRKVGTERLCITYKKIDQALDYIRNHPEVRDVILSGGDALCAPLPRLTYVLSKLRKIPHVEIIRLGSRLPATNPTKITYKLVNTLKKFHPLYINVHFEHPNEITPESIKACERLANAGFPLGNQNVLLDGINNDPIIMGDLYKKLLKMRVKPYYLFQADYVKGTNHFRTKVEDGINIISKLRGYISGLGIPHYVIDAPNGGGKIPIIPDYLKDIDDNKVILTNYKGVKCEYMQKRSD